MLMEDAVGDRHVVKKVDLASMTEEQRRQATQECELLMALRHPNIVKYRESVSTGKSQYTVMQYCEGGSLEQCIAARRKRGGEPFPERQVLRWLAQLAAALQYCHDSNVLHRDIKAANCFLTLQHEDILLGDFGIAKVLESSAAVAQTIIGSPCSMSPEVISGKSYNASSDVWSLGCLFYEMVALRKPFSSHSLNQLVQLVTSERPPEMPKHASSTVKKILSTLLRQDPSKRSTLNELLATPEVQMALPSAGKHMAAPQTAPTLPMKEWLVQHYANLGKIQAYLLNTKKGDEQVVKQQMVRAKPKTPEINQDRLRHAELLKKKRNSAPLAGQVAPEKRLNAKQAKELRDLELEEKRQKIMDEKQQRILREREVQELKQGGRRQHMEERKSAAALRQQNQAPPRPLPFAPPHIAEKIMEREREREREREGSPSVARHSPQNRGGGVTPPNLGGPAGPKPSQQQLEKNALEEKKRRILREREIKKNREAAAEEKAGAHRKANAEKRLRAAELRRVQKGGGGNEAFASTYKGQSSTSAQLMEEPMQEPSGPPTKVCVGEMSGMGGRSMLSSKKGCMVVTYSMVWRSGAPFPVLPSCQSLCYFAAFCHHWRFVAKCCEM